MGRKVLLIGYTTEKTFRHFTNYAMDASSEIDVLDLSLLCKCKSITISESKNDLFIDIDGKIVKNLSDNELQITILDKNFTQDLLPGVDHFFKCLKIF